MSFFVDVHTHLTHEDFESDRDEVINRAIKAGLGAIVVNGLEPRSNRLIIEMAEKYQEIQPALGIYPLDAVCHLIPDDFLFKVETFDVRQEIAFIRQQALSGSIAAIGECGLDGYYLDESYLPAQERVFEELIEISIAADIPVIVHTRKCERRAAEILAAQGAKRVNFHCFGGRAAFAKELAERYGWCFSIPANCTVNEGFQKMLKVMPPESLLTETDAPYLAPVRGQRNEPCNVVATVERLALYRGWDSEDAKKRVSENYTRLFG